MEAKLVPMLRVGTRQLTLMPYTTLLAFGFGNLVMLGWLAAAAAPLLIHLWSRHRHREAPWAAMQFLLAAMRKNARRLQLQQWLLLAVRTLIIALVVLAVAEPYGVRLHAGGSSAPVHRVLVIDASYSMAYREGETTRFARAKQAASELVRESRPADSFTIFRLAAPAAKVVGREIVDRAAITSQIGSLSLSHTSADLASALALVEDAIEQDEADHRPATQHAVYIFSDMQASTWNDKSRELIASLAKNTAVAAIDFGSKQFENLAVTDLTSPSPYVTIGNDTIFDVALTSFGADDKRQQAVELIVDGEPVAEQTVDVTANSSATVRFNHRFQTAGEHTVEARAGGHRLEIDNSRWLVVPARQEIRALCVAGKTDAARYVAEALNPNPAGDSPIRPVVVSDGDLADVDFSGFDCIFMCNVERLANNEAERLSRYVKEGGGVTFFLGDRVDTTAYNALFKNEQQSMVPVKLGEVAAPPSFGIDPREYGHPIVAPFRGRERAGLLSTPISRYHRLELPLNRSDVEVAAAMQNGDPFIVTAPLGRGRTILLATDASLGSVDASGEPWTVWPTWPSFLPLVRQFLSYAMIGQQEDWQRTVNTPLTIRVDSTNAADQPPSALKTQRPDGQTAPVSVQSSQGAPTWNYSDTNLSGIYTLHGLPQAGAKYFAVNVDTTESDLRPVDANELPAELKVSAAASEAPGSPSTAAITHAGFNQTLLWLAFALLFVESFLAWQFGRGVV
jgi:hypothetical protein